MASSTADLRRQLAELEKRIHVELPEAERARMVAVQSKAETVAQAFSDSAHAPRWVNGETEHQYRVRLLSTFKPASPAWKSVDLTKLGDSAALDLAETTIYADAMKFAHDPATAPEGTLREVVETDRTGRKISRFVGSAGACWAPFKAQARLVTGWNTKFK
jgi:hypothetical protein